MLQQKCESIQETLQIDQCRQWAERAAQLIDHFGQSGNKSHHSSRDLDRAQALTLRIARTLRDMGV